MNTPAGVPVGAISQLFASVGDQVTLLNVTDEELAANPGLVKTMSVQPPRGTGRIRLIRIGQGFLFSGEWWILWMPTTFLVLLVVSINILGDFKSVSYLANSHGVRAASPLRPWCRARLSPICFSTVCSRPTTCSTITSPTTAGTATL